MIRSLPLAALLAAALSVAACDTDETEPATAVADTTVTTSEPDATAATTTVADTAEPEVALPPGEMKPGQKGIATHVVDGDTLDLRIGSTTFRVRLRGLSAPECEKGQKPSLDGDWRLACVNDEEFYGVESYKALKALVDGKELTVTCDEVTSSGWCPIDNFDRYLVYLQADGRDVASQMAFGGAGLAYTSFDEASKIAQICAAEYDARSNERGMWAAGSVSQVIGMMSSQTQNWYAQHDRKCDEALGK
jgi:endonuclease YncB( thermonuclease family)